jgi:beta-lactamase superfamily II metal-dependent hydrolase
MFALEAIKAKHGDCLLLHWGSDNDPRIGLIDGGPDTTYTKFLKPRLQALAEERGKEKLPLDMTMVSHIDDDHINGILDLTDDIENGDAPAKVGLIWFNSLEGLLNDKIVEGPKDHATAAVNAMAAGVENEWHRKVLASVPQGQQLHAFAKRTGVFDEMNSPFQPLIMNSKQKAAQVGGLSLTVIGPFADEVEELRKKWKELRKEGITAAFNDKSPYNLSSIVVLAEFGGKRMVLTGDARGDKVLNGFDVRGMLKNGKIHVDLLKLPHHGSQNNATQGFFEQLTADTYVVSGDGIKFPNPHKKAMEMLAAARGGDDYEIFCTYELDHMKQIFGNKLRVPKGNATSITATP